MTDQLRQAAQQVLGAWQTSLYGKPSHQKAVVLAMTNLHIALEQQQAEPVGEVTDTVDGAFKCEFSQHLPVGTKLYTAPRQQAEPVQEPFDGLATELFVVAQRSPVDDGFSDTIDRIESWLREHFSTQPQRKPLTDEQVKELFMKDLGTDYLDDFVCGIRAAEAAHGIKGANNAA